MVAFSVPSTLLSLAGALFASATVANAFNLADVKKNGGSRSVVPGRYIVEFDSSAHLTSAGLKRAASPHEYIYSQLAARSTAYTVHQEYSCELFIGASLSLESDADLYALANITGILDLRPVHLLSLGPQPLSLAELQWSAKSPHSSSGSHGHHTASHTASATASASASPSASPTTGFSANWQIQADKVQAGGNKGKGIKIGIIDGGVDYTREPLGGCFGSGCKVAGGWDFVGDDYDGTNTPVPDADPFDDCYTHGTIVAGIIGANDNEYNVPGVAPEASLYVYRTFGCNGATTDDLVFTAMQRAYDEDMDVINLSVGEVSGWTESMLSVLASRIVAKGTVVVSSAGNQGQVGSFYSYSPAAGQGVINVGSSDNTIYPAQQATVSTGYGPITYYNYQAFTTATLPIYTIASDPYGCVYPDDTPDLSPYLVVVQRGACSLNQKAQLAYYAGATAIFVVNTQDTVPIYQNFPLINFAIIGYEDGNYLLEQASSNTTNVTVSFDWSPIAAPNIWTGNTTSYFSEIGPTNDLFFAPSVLAPGQNIINVLPSTYANWSISDGTSWSSGFISGAAALYLAAKGKNNVSPADVKSAFEFSAEQLPVSVEDSSLASVAVQGAGRVQLYEALNAGAVVSPTELTLNDTAYFNSLQYVTVKNPTKKWVTYKLSNVPAGTALAYQTGVNQSNDQPVPQVSNAASVKFWPSQLTLWPGQTAVVTLQFTAPKGLDAQTFPIYSGFIQIAGGANTVQVPYLGVAAKMRNMPIIDPTPYYLGINSPTILDEEGDVQSGPATYTFSNTSYPTVLYRLVGGSPYVLIDLVDAATNLTFTPNYTSRKRDLPSSPAVEIAAMKRSFLEARRAKATGVSFSRTKTPNLLTLWCHYTQYRGKGCVSAGNTFLKVPILGNLYEEQYVARHTDNVDSEGGDYATFELSTATFANGTTIPNGSYKFLMRALHITGDITKESDYEAWLSETFTVAQ
ncbi:hypothetical protein IAT38_004347 [Cryptococcus sp. DSM 104549]